jgi:hypothetical protein
MDVKGVSPTMNLRWVSDSLKRAETWTSVATLILAIATIWLALGMYRQIGVMQDDQRPWVGMEAGVLERPGIFLTNDGVPTDGYFIVVISNGGKSPALNVTLTLLNWNVDINTVKFPINKCGGSCRITNTELLPGDRLNLLIPEFGKQPIPKPGDTGNIIARIDYTDAHGTLYVTAMCVKVITALVAPRRMTTDQAGCTESDSNFAS